MNNIVDMLAEELDVNKKYLNNVIELLDSGNTVPFIARYRKELTGSMSDVTLRKLEERLTYLRNLKSRKEDVIRIISEQGKLTDELQKSIEKSNTLTEVEDIYRPYKPKKRTRAIIAQEKGLKSLSQVIWDGNFNEDIEKYASEFINEEKGVDSVKDALAGAMDIISEIISDEAKYRKWIRKFVNDNGLIETKGESKEPTPYEMYYDYREAIKSIPAHRVLAINRGEKEKVLSVKVTCDMDRILEYLKAQCIKENSITDAYIEKSVEDSLKRLIYPSIEREIRSELTDMGEEGAIKIFKANLKALLMQPPIKGKNVLGYDPGFRNGCKIAVLDDTGKLLDTAIIYPTAPQNDVDGSIKN